MHFSEDDLKKALSREDPGEAFTQRVMARVSQMEEAKASAAGRRAKRYAWLRWLTVRPAWSVAVAALALVIGFGVGYKQYERYQERKEQDRIAEFKKAKEAEQQVMLALRITNAKLNHVFKRVNEPLAPEPQQEQKIRRQSL